jgi:hypothetical protein
MQFCKKLSGFQEEEQKLRADMRRDSKVKRMREKAPGRGLTAGYLEGADSDEEDISIAAIKNKYKKNKKGGKRSFADLRIAGRQNVDIRFEDVKMLAALINLTWVRCYDHNFLRFLTISGEKIGVFPKTQCYDQNFA